MSPDIKNNIVEPIGDNRVTVGQAIVNAVKVLSYRDGMAMEGASIEPEYSSDAEETLNDLLSNCTKDELIEIINIMVFYLPELPLMEQQLVSLEELIDDSLMEIRYINKDK